MRRRDILVALALAAVGRAAWAQPPRRPRLALVHSGIPAARLTENGGTLWIKVFFEELRRLGYAEGQSLLVERYSAKGHLERLAELARAVVGRKPDVIVANGPLVPALKAATATIPIAAIMGDPIKVGVVASLARPGANLTGVSVDAGSEVYGKQLQILKEVVPSASRIAYLGSRTNWDGALGEAVRKGGKRLGVSVIGVPLKEATPSELHRAFAEIARRRLDAVMVSPSGEFLAKRQLIVDLAKADRLPGMYPYRDFVEAGGLMAYAPDLAELASRLADQVRQILHGANPGEIPIYQVTRFTLILNGNTAKALGLAIPPAVLARADEVIQ